MLWSLAGMLRAKTDTLAHVETLDCGKPIAEARVDTRCCLDTLDIPGAWKMVPAPMKPMPVRIPWRTDARGFNASA
jgi:acyl-CoA reductase-like NAD-dependent aldehyde dehydrogenase